MTTQLPAPAPATDATVLQQLARSYYDLLAAFERAMGVSRARWLVLAQLLRAERLTQAELTTRLRVDAAAVTRQVKQLEQEQRVSRWPDPADNRFTLVALTAAGRALAAELQHRRLLFDTIALEGIDEADLAAMERCLAQIRANLAGVHSDS
jgi:DNA-binding MarR family transcriptional regulator